MANGLPEWWDVREPSEDDLEQWRLQRAADCNAGVHGPTCCIAGLGQWPGCHCVHENCPAKGDG